MLKQYNKRRKPSTHADTHSHTRAPPDTQPGPHDRLMLKPTLTLLSYVGFD